MKDAYGILLIVVLVLVSGLIAYIGDILGRRLGRRRITLFGLRPRHTAIAISVVAGMIITLLTLLAAVAVSEDVRAGLTRVSEMRQQLGELEQLVESNRRQLDKAKERTRQAEAERKIALQSFSQAKQQAGQITSKLQNAETNLKATLSEMRQVSSRLKISHGKLQAVQAQFDATGEELKKKKEELAKGEAIAFTTSRSLLEIEHQRDQLASQREQLEKEVTGLQEQEKNLRAESENLQKEVSRLTGMVEIAAPALTQETVVEVGQEIGRETFAADQPIADLRRQLEDFISELEATVRSAGAGNNPEGRAVNLSRRIVQGNDIMQIPQDSQFLELLAQQIHAFSGSVVVRAFSLLNVPHGRPVPVELLPVQNQLVFKQNDKLAEKTFDSRAPEAELLVEIVMWLRQEVAAHARQAGMLPDLSPASEKTLLFGTTNYPVGRITPEQLFAILQRVKKYHAPVRIRARVAKDTYSAGPLQIDLAIVNH